MKTKLLRSVVASSLFACASVTLIAGLTFSRVDSAQAQARGPMATCGLNTLRGSYLFTANGYNIVGGVAQPKAIVEGINFNGDGTLVSPFATVSINGNIIHASSTPGIYTLNADCTGTLSFNNGPSSDIFADVSGRELTMIQTGPGAPVFEGTATRMAGW